MGDGRLAALVDYAVGRGTKRGSRFSNLFLLQRRDGRHRGRRRRELHELAEQHLFHPDGGHGEAESASRAASQARFRGAAGQGVTGAVSARRSGFATPHRRPPRYFSPPSARGFPAQGIGGGEAGATGAVEINGEPVEPKIQHLLQPGDVVTLRTPGGGGHGPPCERDPGATARDRTLGYT